MSNLPLTTGAGGENLFYHITQALAGQGYIVLPAALAPGLVDALFIHFNSLEDNAFKAAGVGRHSDHSINQFVRTDQIAWIDKTNIDKTSIAIQTYLSWIEDLRLALNRYLFLGLFEYECHYAHYPQGAFYKKHRDAFKGEQNRMVSTVLYLNPNWQPQDGGELVLYSLAENDTSVETISPQYGKLVIFLSEDFPHEVLPTQKSRRSIAGWFRINNNMGSTIDPPV